MADLNHNLTRILMVLCTILILLGLVGHFLMDIGGSTQTDTFSLHTGYVSVPPLVMGGLLSLVFMLIGNTLTSLSLFLPPPVQPPVVLR